MIEITLKKSSENRKMVVELLNLWKQREIFPSELLYIEEEKDKDSVQSGIKKPFTKRRKLVTQPEKEEEQTCTICLESIRQESSSLNGCVHIFHFQCIFEWSKITNLCPLCKTEFKTIIKKSEKGKLHKCKVQAQKQRLPEDYSNEEINFIIDEDSMDEDFMPEDDYLDFETEDIDDFIEFDDVDQLEIYGNEIIIISDDENDDEIEGENEESSDDENSDNAEEPMTSSKSSLRKTRKI